jgi:predicted AAA+ superfamily ATPase
MEISDTPSEFSWYDFPVITRTPHLAAVRELLALFPVVAILGARQAGKTTLARQLGAAREGAVHRFDLEDPDDLARLADPAFVLKELDGLIVLDEIQTRPDLFPLLRALADRPGTNTRFLLLGSASPELLRLSAETLAGRIGFHELPGLSLAELEAGSLDRLWRRGGFPRAYLAATDAASRQWREAFIRTYLERDIPQLGIRLPAIALRRFWTMLAHYHGQTWNGSELGRALAVSDKTVMRYLEILEGTYMAFRLPPWHTNLGKREIKAPKVYLADTGLLHTLLGIERQEALLAHPKCGASWEGLALREVILHARARPAECFFWGAHSGAELDLLIVRDGRKYGFEARLTRSPGITPSMRSALDALGLEHLFVICHGGEPPWPLAERITAVPLGALPRWAAQSGLGAVS